MRTFVKKFARLHQSKTILLGKRCHCRTFCVETNNCFIRFFRYIPTRFLNLLIHVFKVLFPSLQPYFLFRTIASANMRSWVHVWWSTSVWMNAIQTKRNGWRNDIEKKNLSSRQTKNNLFRVKGQKEDLFPSPPVWYSYYFVCVYSVCLKFPFFKGILIRAV